MEQAHGCWIEENGVRRWIEPKEVVALAREFRKNVVIIDGPDEEKV